jgi:DMSO reductase family type II enzyme chaperone
MNVEPKMSRSREKVVEDALKRSRAYHLLSDAFSYPGEELFRMLKGSFLEELTNQLGHTDGGNIGFDFRPLRESVNRVSNLSHLASEYTRCFGHTLSTECPPYETQYQYSHIFQQTQGLADIAGFYRAFGLEVSDSAGERLDHITVELEFMGFLAYKQVYAMAQHGEEQVEICLDALKKFMREHLGRWVPTFATQLARKAGEGFYKEVAEFTAWWVLKDAEQLGVKPLTLEETKAARIETEEDGCLSCPVASLAEEANLE